MFPGRLELLAEVFVHVADPRGPREVLHPRPGSLPLSLLRLLTPMGKWTVLPRWESTLGCERIEPLGFERSQQHRATTIRLATERGQLHHKLVGNDWGALLCDFAARCRLLCWLGRFSPADDTPQWAG